MTNSDSTTQPPKAQEHALAPTKPSSKGAVITTPEEYHARLTKWRNDKYHILSPMTHVGFIPGHYALVPSTVDIDPDPAIGEVYQDKLFCEKDEYALARPALGKIATSAGFSIVTEDLTPTHSQNYWKVVAKARFIGIDGTVKVRTAMADYDLRDGSPRIKKMQAAAKRNNRNPEQQIDGARQYGLRGCETRAINAVIRLTLGLKQKYDVKELKKPFLCVQVVFQPDMSNPVIAKAVAEHALAGVSMLFGTMPEPSPMAAAPVIGHLGVGAPEEQPRPEVEQHATAQRVVKVAHDPEAGLHSVWFEGDDTEYFAREAVAKVAQAAKDSNSAVQVTIKENEDDGALWVAHLESLGAAPPASKAAEPESPPDVKFIADVKVITTGTNPRGHKWTLYQITAKGGEYWGTFSDKHATDATRAKEQGLPVRITEKPNERDASKVDIDTLTVIE